MWAAPALALLLAVWGFLPPLPAQAEGSPLVALRADHMVLDVAVLGERVLVATQSGRIEAHDWREGRRLPDLLALDPEPGRDLPPTVSCVTVSPTARRVAAASSDEKLWLFELDAQGAVLGRRILSSGPVVACRFLDEGRLVLGDLRGELTLLDWSDGEELFRRQLDYDPVYAIAVSPGGSRVAVGLRSSRVHVLDAESGRAVRLLEGHKDSVFAVGWAGDDLLVSGSKDKRVLAWDLAADPPRPRILYQGDHYITALAIDGDRLALTLGAHQIGLLGIRDGRIRRGMAAHTAPVQRFAFLDGGRRLLSAGNDARVLVWDVGEDEGGAPS